MAGLSTQSQSTVLSDNLGLSHIYTAASQKGACDIFGTSLFGSLKKMQLIDC
jgi:hypothetical protein